MDRVVQYTCTRTLGGFNVSNLMGITRRMIDIVKKITFFCKKCFYYPKNFFVEKYQYGYQKNAEFYADFKFVGADLNKARAKKLCEF